VAAAHRAVRERVKPLTEDRPLYKDIAAVAEIIAGGGLVEAVEGAVGGLA
jgi:histidine ammonia-lyase